MIDELKRVLGRTDCCLDFLSVVDGFRDVGLIGLIENHYSFNQNAGTQIPPYNEQLTVIQEYLMTNKPDYILIHAWLHLYFVARRDRIEDIKKLLEDYPIPIESTEGERRLGLLLGFPECCVAAHVNGKDIGKKEGFYVLPFAPCSLDCEEPWMDEYLRLARKYDIDSTRRLINGNE